jgi:hypothetical protein
VKESHGTLKPFHCHVLARVVPLLALFGTVYAGHEPISTGGSIGEAVSSHFYADGVGVDGYARVTGSPATPRFDFVMTSWFVITDELPARRHRGTPPRTGVYEVRFVGSSSRVARRHVKPCWAVARGPH